MALSGQGDAGGIFRGPLTSSIPTARDLKALLCAPHARVRDPRAQRKFLKCFRDGDKSEGVSGLQKEGLSTRRTACADDLLWGKSKLKDQ